ncbi:MAG: hypothetical protein ACRED8_01910, partial [Caulobacteraceae bacterium]
LAALGAAALVPLAPTVVRAQDAAMTPDASATNPEHGNWTLNEREHWLDSRLDMARDQGSIDHHEYNHVKHEIAGIRHEEDRMRDNHDGQLTDNETAMLETRLDTVADQIHWLHENSFTKPW